MKTPSIRSVLLVRCGVGVGMLLCMLSTGIYLLVRHGLYQELDQSIEQTAALLSNQVELENGRITFEWQEGIGTNRALIDDGLFQYWDEKSGKTTRSPGLQSRDLPRFYGTNGKPLLKDIQLPDRRRQARAIGMRVYPFILPEEMERMKASGRMLNSKDFPHILVVARDTKPVHHVLTRLRWILGTGTLLTLGFIFILIDRAIHVSLRPIDDLAEQARHRTGNLLDVPLNLPEALPSELTGLAGNFDSLLARVAAIRQRERDFIRHAAHELRTPIAALRATTDLALSKPREASAYAGYLESCRKSAFELGELVKRLSALSRVGQSSATATLETIDLGALVDQCLDRFASGFEQRNIKVRRMPHGEPLLAIGDSALACIVINNLLDNASAYAPTGSESVIRFGTSAAWAELSISNPVDSIPDEPDRLFEPLFRREASRHDADSHLGIGLTLSLDAARAMGGTLRVETTRDGWIDFVFGLPCPGK